MVAVPATAGDSEPGARGQAIVPVDAAAVMDRIEADHGGPVLLNVWATWCRPCRKEMPDLLRLRKTYRGSGFELVLVSADFENQLAAAGEFLDSLGVTFETYHKRQNDVEFIDGIDPDWSGAIPYSALYDARGRRVNSWYGRIDYDTAAASLDSLLR